jgi:hypothetical protein
MLLLGWFCDLDLFKTGWRAAARDLPRFAEEHNLAFEPSSLAHQMGAVHGQWDGYEVHVLPDERATLRVVLRSSGRVRLATFAPRYAAVSDEFVEFSTGNAAFDAFFKTRFAAVELVPQLRESEELHRIVASGLAPWKRKLRFCEVGAVEIRASVAHGWRPFIPIDRAAGLLPVLVQLAAWLEAADGRQR